MWKNLQDHMSAQRRHRSACTTPQSDQSSLSASISFGSLAAQRKPSKASVQVARSDQTVQLSAQGELCLFVLRLNVPVNNFFSHVGTEPPLPG